MKGTVERTATHLAAGERRWFPAVHVVNRYHYRKVTVFLWIRAFQWEQRW